jgi:hypothetical protein
MYTTYCMGVACHTHSTNTTEYSFFCFGECSEYGSTVESAAVSIIAAAIQKN